MVKGVDGALDKLWQAEQLIIEGKVNETTQEAIIKVT